MEIGQHAGLPVYRRVNGDQDEIFVPAVAGGMLAPFRRRG
jgi:hypothetical protein